MSAILLSAEFQSKLQTASFKHWLQAQVQAAIDNPRPGTPHDEVMAEMEALIVEAEALHPKSA